VFFVTLYHTALNLFIYRKYKFIVAKLISSINTTLYLYKSFIIFHWSLLAVHLLGYWPGI